MPDSGIPPGDTSFKESLLGSFIQKGYDSVYYDNAIRRVLVKGIDENEESLQKAITSYVDGSGEPGSGLGAGYYHPITGVPLSRIRITRESATRARIDAYYQRKRYNYTPTTGGNIASFRLGYEWTEVFKTNQAFDPPDTFTTQYDEWGLPDGDWWQGGPGDQPKEMPREQFPKSMPYSQATVRIVVPTRLNFNPISTVLDKVNAVNETQIKFGAGDEEAVFAAETVRFDAADINWYEEGSGRFYFYVNYLFTARSGGWREQMVFDELGEVSSSPISRWICESFQPYQIKDFTGDNFPYG